MKKVEKSLINKWYKTLDKGTETFLDFAEHCDVNSFRLIDGVKCVLFENGNNYTVDSIMKETDGEKEKEIIAELVACGVDFDEPKSFIETGACGTYYDWGIKDEKAN